MSEKMVPYSIRLKTDQITFLRSIRNPSDFVRKALDQAILNSVSLEDKVIPLTRKISALELQVTAIEGSVQYQKAKRGLPRLGQLIQRSYFALELLKKPEKWIVKEYFEPHKNALTCMLICLEKPDIRVEMHGTEKEAGLSEETSTQTKRLNELKKEEEYFKKVIETYDQSILRIKDQIEELKKQVLVIQ